MSAQRPSVIELNKLRHRFEALMGGLGCDGAAFDLLHRRYSETGRYYHNWQHIRECLREFDWIAPALRDPTAVELALWFHDVVYVPGGVRNEHDSAELAYATLRPCGRLLAQKVWLYIRETDYSRPRTLLDPDFDYLQDIDFAAFGKPFEAFWQDIEDLRRELAATSGEHEDIDARVAFYQDILSGRVVLFRTPEFCDRYLARARDNLSRGIARLREERDGFV